MRVATAMSRPGRGGGPALRRGLDDAERADAGFSIDDSVDEANAGNQAARLGGASIISTLRSHSRI